MRRKTKRENIKIWKIFRAEEKEAIICRRKTFLDALASLDFKLSVTE